MGNGLGGSGKLGLMPPGRISHKSGMKTSAVGLQYREEAAGVLAQVVELLRRLDALGAAERAQRLDEMEPLAERLERIRHDLDGGRMLPALKRSNELRAQLSGGQFGMNDPQLRSAVAAILGSYKRAGSEERARQGGLKGGRPRKDGKPVMTLERKGYSLDFLPPKKVLGMRVHPPRRELC